jgi:hypothetical protein
MHTWRPIAHQISPAVAALRAMKPRFVIIACALIGCATPPAITQRADPSPNDLSAAVSDGATGPETAPEGVPKEVRREVPKPLPEALRRCTKHSDCALTTELDRLYTETSCRGLIAPHVAINVHEAAQLAQPTCPGPCDCADGTPICCPPIARQEVYLHAVCFQSQCEVRPGADWTEDERAEDAAGRGTDAHGECYAASDCAPQPLTSFPQGLTDAQGHDLCPVCPRPGQPLADEEAHIAERAPRCPQRACAPTALECRQYTCALSPTRPPREQARALPPQTLEQPEPPYTPPLPSGADYACTSTADCTLGHINACRCDRPTEPMNKKAAAERDALPPSSCPCIVQQDPPPGAQGRDRRDETISNRAKGLAERAGQAPPRARRPPPLG